MAATSPAIAGGRSERTATHAHDRKKRLSSQIRSLTSLAKSALTLSRRMAHTAAWAIFKLLLG